MTLPIIPNWAEGCLDEYCKPGHGDLPRAVVGELQKLPDMEDRVHEYKLALWNEAQVSEYLKPNHGNLQPYQVKALEDIPGWLEHFIQC